MKIKIIRLFEIQSKCNQKVLKKHPQHHYIRLQILH
jgi:hypothetical protein